MYVLSHFSRARPALCDPVDCRPQAPLSMGSLQARILERVAMPGDLSDPGIELNLLRCRQILHPLSYLGSPASALIFMQILFPTEKGKVGGGIKNQKTKNLPAIT